MIVRCLCGKTLRVADQLAGKTVRCPSCGECFVAQPSSAGISPVAAPAPAPAMLGNLARDRAVSAPPQSPARSSRPSPLLLIASAGLAVLALLGFAASSVLLVLGVNASPVNGPAAARSDAKPEPNPVAAPAPNQEPVLPPLPAAPVVPQPPPAGPPKEQVKEGPAIPAGAPGAAQKSKDEVYCLNEIYGNSFSVSSNDRMLCAGGNELVVMDLTKGSIVHKFQASNPSFTHARFLPDGKQALVARSDGRTEVLDVETGKSVRSLAIKSTLVLELSADGRRALGGGGPADRFVHQWDVASGREIARTELMPHPVQQLSVSTNGQRVLLNRGSLPFFWDVTKGDKVRQLSVPIEISAVHLALSPDGKRALIATGKRFYVWDVDRDVEIAHFEPERQPVCVAFAPDGRTALAGSSGTVFHDDKMEAIDSYIWLYDLERRKQVRRFDGHRNAIFFLAFTHDGRRVVSYAFDHTVRVWQLPAREEGGNP